MSRKKIYIAGSGGLAKEVNSLFLANSREFVFAGYLDEVRENCDSSKNIFPIGSFKPNAVVVAIGDPKLKARLRDRFGDAYFPALIHERAIVTDAQIGRGSIIFPNVTLTANNVIGSFCTIYQNCSVSHDTVIGGYCNITPGVDIAGRCKIGSHVYLGIGSSISNNISICDYAIVGAGAVVVDDITEPGTYVGVPARKIK